MIQIPEDGLPQWLTPIVTLVLGAGGVHWFRVFLENRRLSKKEFRETLLDRIHELETVVAQLQVRMGNLRVEMAHLEVENKQLQRQLEEERDYAFEQDDTGDDGNEPS